MRQTQAEGESPVSWRQFMEFPDILSSFLTYYPSSSWHLDCVTFDREKRAQAAHTWAKGLTGMPPSTLCLASLVLATVKGMLLRQRFVSWVPWTILQRWGGSSVAYRRILKFIVYVPLVTVVAQMVKNPPASLVCCSPWGSQRVGHNLVTEQQQQQ